MIKIGIEVREGKTYDHFEDEDVTLNEAALALYKLEEMKLKIMNDFKFPSNFEMKEGYEDD